MSSKRAQRILDVDRLRMNGSRILLLGLAYKFDVFDTRESPALDLVSGLEQLGADVSNHDTWVPEIFESGLVPH